MKPAAAFTATAFLACSAFVHGASADSASASGVAPSTTSAPAAGSSSRANTDFFATQTNSRLQAKLSAEYAAYSSLVAVYPEYSSLLDAAQNAFTKDLNADNAMAHMSTYASILLGIAVHSVGGGIPASALVVPGPTPGSAAGSAAGSAPAAATAGPAAATTTKGNSAAIARPAVALVAAAAAAVAALF